MTQNTLVVLLSQAAKRVWSSKSMADRPDTVCCGSVAPSGVWALAEEKLCVGVRDLGSFADSSLFMTRGVSPPSDILLSHLEYEGLE